MKENQGHHPPNKLPVLRDAPRCPARLPRHDGDARRGLQRPTRHIPARVKIKDELTDYTPKVRSRSWRRTRWPESIFQRITEVAQTGHYGDGLVWITDIERLLCFQDYA